MFKKSIAFLSALALVLALYLPFTANAETTGSFAAAPDAEKGKQIAAEYTVKTDSSITEIYIYKVTLSSDKIQYTGVSAPSGWTVKDNSVKPAAKGAKEVKLKLNFKVAADAPSGETVAVNTVAAVSSDTDSGYTLSGALALKIPADAAAAASEPQPSLLSSLSVENGTLSPAFSPNNFIYSVKVPYEVTDLAVTAVSDDKAAKITVENTQLAENEVTAVIVTVISAAGRQVYRINATREARKQSGNTNLSSLTAEGFMLSPPFSNDVTEYVVWAPYETENIKFTATAEDALAAVDIKAPETLKPGEFNDVTVSVKAENGGEKQFKIRVKRAAKGEGLGGNDKKSETDTTPETVENVKNTDSGSNGNIRLRYAIIGFAAGVVLSAAAVFAAKSGLFAKAAAAVTKKKIPQTEDEYITLADDDGMIAEPDGAADKNTDENAADGGAVDSAKFDKQGYQKGTVKPCKIKPETAADDEESDSNTEEGGNSLQNSKE